MVPPLRRFFRLILGASSGCTAICSATGSRRLLAGLVILQVLFLVPYAGGILRFAVLCLGLGALALQMRRQVQ